ncbi:tetratricopeptide repeat protein, partial [Candidatus Caldatribacterium sp.]|uniref:tetratricopeptide repeat protein n=1 Tax=Candidatus Caldatribacterium sp. TaxID=2282143 RepID=UPI00383FD12A|nr:tetratricopeptide repeat protein [Candidatus Caldatribacterium sp.]
MLLGGEGIDTQRLLMLIAELERGAKITLLPSQAELQDPDELLARGKYLVRERRYSEALVSLQRLVRQRGEGEDYHWLGVALYELGRYRDALEAFHAAAKLSRKGAEDAWVARCKEKLAGQAKEFLDQGIRLLQGGKTRKARKLFAKAVTLRGSGEDYFYLGFALMQFSKPRAREALPCLEKAVELQDV